MNIMKYYVKYLDIQYTYWKEMRSPMCREVIKLGLARADIHPIDHNIDIVLRSSRSESLRDLEIKYKHKQ